MNGSVLRDLASHSSLTNSSLNIDTVGEMTPVSVGNALVVDALSTALKLSGWAMDKVSMPFL